jgi:hypothetical protein
MINYNELFAAIQDRVDTVGINQTKKEITSMEFSDHSYAHKISCEESYSEKCDKFDNG